MLYLECNCNHNSASCFCAHSPLWGGRGREGKKGGGGEECEKDKIMTEKEDRTVSGLAQSRDLFESQDEDNLKRSQYCVCNNILCNCDENPDSKSLLGR